jgi:hypothetical protein
MTGQILKLVLLDTKHTVDEVPPEKRHDVRIYGEYDENYEPSPKNAIGCQLNHLHLTTT